jgi:GDP-L-fucose synthase
MKVMTEFFEGKRVLVTGGTGFVGRHYVDDLIKRGAMVRVPVHLRECCSETGKVEFVGADLCDIDDCRRVCEGADYVVHAAGAVAAAGVTSSNPMSAITTNLVLSTQMLEAAWDEGVERFLIFGSSTGYPVSDKPVKEDDMWSGDTHASYFGYGWMRRYLERISEFVASKTDMGIALIRPTATYGRFDNFDPVTSHVIPALIRRALEHAGGPFEVWGTGAEVRDFLHVKDLVRGSLLVLEKHAVCDPVNIGYGKTILISELVDEVLCATGRKDLEVKFDPSRPTAIPIRTVDTSKAKTLFGFEPAISLKEGIADTVKWYRDESSKRNILGVQ